MTLTHFPFSNLSYTVDIFLTYCTFIQSYRGPHFEVFRYTVTKYPQSFQISASYEGFLGIIKSGLSST